MAVAICIRNTDNNDTLFGQPLSEQSKIYIMKIIIMAMVNSEVT